MLFLWEGDFLLFSLDARVTHLCMRKWWRVLPFDLLLLGPSSFRKGLFCWLGAV